MNALDQIAHEVLSDTANLTVIDKLVLDVGFPVTALAYRGTALAANKALAVTLNNGSKVILFDQAFKDSTPAGVFTGIIQHEVGHLVLGHSFTASSWLRNELEADSYAVTIGRANPVDMFKGLVSMYGDYDITVLTASQKQMLNLERNFRLANLAGHAVKYSLNKLFKRLFN
jgi:hypothetical protein